MNYTKMTWRTASQSSVIGVSGHLAEATEVVLRFLERMHCCRGHRAAILGMPLLVLLLAFWAICCASTIQGHVESLHLVHVVLVHATLRKDVLSPSAILPVAAVIGARTIGLVAVLQVLGQHIDRFVAHDLQVSEEAVLHILAILEVDAMRRLAVFVVAQPTLQPAWHENCIGIDLHRPTLALPLTQVPHLQPDLVEKTPIDPSAARLALDPVELTESVVHFLS